MNTPSIQTHRNMTLRMGFRHQRGFTLVELMVATTLAVFLLGGLFASLQSTRHAYGNQTSLAQLQDNERLAMTLMADVIESAGYFPLPKTNNAASVFGITAPFTAPGQYIIGTANAAAPGDTITVRFDASNNDNTFDCIGQKNTTGAEKVYVSQFRVIGGTTNQLVCTVAGVDYPLITSGVTNLQISYGVKHNAGNTGSCADTYLTSTQMTATDWNVICSVRVSLTFTNPLLPASPITINRVIAVMTTAGVNT